jgi:hypothetical protein
MDIISEEPKAISRIHTKEWESRHLPEHPFNQTFRGRYEYLDTQMLDLIGVEKLPSGTEINVLDFAGGVLPFGSPTAHDLFDAIQGIGLKPKITVVDKNIPANLEPNYPEIKYKNSIDDVKGDLDIVRILHLAEYIGETISQEEYDEIHRKLSSQLREGGLMITSQRLFWINERTDGNQRPFPPVIKIMQKRNGILMPIALIPDSLVVYNYKSLGANYDPKNPDLDMTLYLDFRESVLNGTAEIKRGVDSTGFETTVSALNENINNALTALNKDNYYLHTYPPNPGDILGYLKVCSGGASDRFAAGKRLILAQKIAK